MTPSDFRRIALSLGGVEEVTHAGWPAFRAGGARFASLAAQSAGYGNLTLKVEQQAAFVQEAPEIFLPIPGGFGRMGHTHIRLAAANEDVLAGALRTAWKLQIEKKAKRYSRITFCLLATREFEAGDSGTPVERPAALQVLRREPESAMTVDRVDSHCTVISPSAQIGQL